MRVGLVLSDGTAPYQCRRSAPLLTTPSPPASCLLPRINLLLWGPSLGRLFLCFAGSQRPSVQACVCLTWSRRLEMGGEGSSVRCAHEPLFPTLRGTCHSYRCSSCRPTPSSSTLPTDSPRPSPAQDRSLSKAKLLKIDFAQACDEIGRSTGAGAGLRPPAEEVTTSEEEEEEEEAPKRRRRVVKKKRRVGAAVEAEEGALGLRLSANLLLGVARSVSLLSEASRALRGLSLVRFERPFGRVYDLQVHAASVRPAVAILRMSGSTRDSLADRSSLATDSLHRQPYAERSRPDLPQPPTWLHGRVFCASRCRWPRPAGRQGPAERRRARHGRDVRPYASYRSLHATWLTHEDILDAWKNDQHRRSARGGGRR